MPQQSKVLVVEDREDWQDIVCDTIVAEGLTPSSARTANEALEALGTEQFDLAVIDPILDTNNRFNRDGLSIIQKIDETHPGTPLVIITGSLTHDIRTSLERLCPNAPVVFKESWNPLEFIGLLHRLTEEHWTTTINNSTPEEEQIETSTLHSPIPPTGTESDYPRVLVVENNASWQSIISSTLGEMNYFWRIANTAEEALTKLNHLNYHVVILDLKLQQNDLPLRNNEGWLLLDELIDRYPKIKLVIISGKASPNDVAYLLTHYPIHFISKQYYSTEDLHNIISKITAIPKLQLQTFGQFRVWRNDTALGVWDPPEAETVVKVLLAYRARGQQTVPLDDLVTHLWGHVDEEKRKSLLPIINSARHILEPDIEPQDSNFILRGANGYFFNLNEQIHWDLINFREHLAVGEKLLEKERWTEAIGRLENGRAIYRGDFLPMDRNSDWANTARREINRDFCNLLTTLADAYAALGEYSQAIDMCETSLRKDPLQEGIYRRLMQFNYCNDDKSRALKAYRDCIKLFEELFGESPAAATRQLHRAILNEEVLDCSQQTS